MFKKLWKKIPVGFKAMWFSGIAFGLILIGFTIWTVYMVGMIIMYIMVGG